MTRRSRPAMAAVVLAVSLACTSCSLFGKDEPRPSPTASATVTTPVPLTADSARRLETQARSGDVAEVGKAFVLPDGDQVRKDFISGLAALQRLAIDDKAFRQTTDTTASVPVVTTDANGVATRWTATLTLVDGAWRIAATEKTP